MAVKNGFKILQKDFDFTKGETVVLSWDIVDGDDQAIDLSSGYYGRLAISDGRGGTAWYEAYADTLTSGGIVTKTISSEVTRDWTPGNYSVALVIVNENSTNPGIITEVATGRLVVQKVIVPEFLVALTYNGNGEDDGTAPAGTSARIGTEVTVAGFGDLEKDGKVVQHWNTAADGNGTNYLPGAKFYLDVNTTLYAKWLTNSFTVTYNGNTNTGGTAPVDSDSPYEHGDEVTVLGEGDLVKTGKVFAGWNTAANGSGTAYEEDEPFEIAFANVTLYAQWADE